MPEGDTIFRAAATLHRVLAGRVVTRFASAFPSLNRVADDHPIAGRRVESVAARGKHLLMTFSGDLILHTHLRMNGSWHVYPAGARWRRPARDMRVLVATAEAEAVGFNIPVAEFLTPATLARHRTLTALGPDLLDARFDRAAVLARLHARPAEAIADLLLDQRVVAGIGNVFKSEILFLAGVFPFAPAGTLADATLETIVGVALTLLRANVADRPTAPTRGRRTTGRLHPAEGLWVYGRGGRPCRRCGTLIAAAKTGVDARLTYWCPSCQSRRVR